MSADKILITYDYEEVNGMFRMIIGVIVLIPSMLGYILTLTSRYRVPFAFAPAIVFAFVAVVQYLAGILNVMHLSVVLLCLGGLLLLISGLLHGLTFPRFSFAIAVFGILLVYLLWFCYNGVYADGDTMTHWGVVVREMAELDRFPNFSTQEVAYQSYPTGSASFIYFFCTVLGYSEPVTLFAQGLLIVGCLLTLSAFAEKSGVVGKIVLGLFLAFALHFNVRLDDLKVDHLLSVLCMAVIAVTTFCRDNSRRAAFLVSPMLCLLSVVKSSGVFFALISILPLLYAVNRNKLKRRDWLTVGILTIVLPTLMVVLWNAHTDMVFLSADSTRHSASLSYMLQVFHNKGTEELMLILRNYVHIWLSLDRARNASGEWVLLVICTFVLVGGNWYRRLVLKEKSLLEYAVLATSFGAYFVYKLLLLGMYLFNMPDSDAVGIGAYLRYTSSITIVLYAVVIMYTLFLLSRNKEGVRRPWTLSKAVRTTALTVALAVCLAAFPMANPTSFSRLARPDYKEDGCYRRLVQIRDQNALPSRDGRILVYTKTLYADFFVIYCFRSLDALCVSAATLQEQYKNYDYLIIMEHDDDIDAALTLCGLPVTRSVVALSKTIAE